MVVEPGYCLTFIILSNSNFYESSSTTCVETLLGCYSGLYIADIFAKIKWNRETVVKVEFSSYKHVHLLKLDKTSDISYFCMLQSPVNQLQYDNNVGGEDSQTHELELTNSALEFRCHNLKC